MIKLLLSIMLLAFYAQAMAAAPMSKITTPGFYRFMLGDFEVTALSDGHVALPMNNLLSNISKSKLEKEFNRSGLKSPTETPVNAYLVNTGTKLVLIDAGAAALFGPTLGKLIPNLKASGYQPEQVDEIYITHLHNDHIGGLFTDSKISFPNAVVRADQHDLDYWLSKENLEKAPANMKGFFEGPMATFAPYQKENKIKPFEGSTDLVDGIKALNTHGHTPGHTVYQVESKGQKLIIIGDLIHVGAVQFSNPTVTIAFDSNSKEAFAQRVKVFSDAAKNLTIVGAAHIAFPGLGHLRADGKGFTWLPL